METSKQTAVIAILVIAVSSYCIQTTLASSIGITEGNDASVNYESINKSEDLNLIGHKRIQCEFEEPTEVVICQEHCLPKGYSYGICVSHTCSCI